MEPTVTDTPLFHEQRTGPLRAAVFDTVRAWDGVETGTVFGCPAFLVGGVPFALVTDRGLTLTRLTADDSERLRVRWSGLTFDPNRRPSGSAGVSRATDAEDRPVRSDGGRRGSWSGESWSGESWPVVPVGGNDVVLLRRFVRLSYDGARTS